jgi:hypothetical protein
MDDKFKIEQLECEIERLREEISLLKETIKELEIGKNTKVLERYKNIIYGKKTI